MKKIIAFFSSFILIVFLLIINFDYEKSSIVENNITDYKIFIDAGHGGMDPGTYSGNIFEKELNLKIAKKLGDIFIQNNCFIYFSRTEDYDLSKEDSYNHKIDDLKKRAEMINFINPDLLISLHLNSLIDNSVFPTAVGPVRTISFFIIYYPFINYIIRLNFFSNSYLLIEIIVGLP